MVGAFSAWSYVTRYGWCMVVNEHGAISAWLYVTRYGRCMACVRPCQHGAIGAWHVLLACIANWPLAAGAVFTLVLCGCFYSSAHHRCVEETAPMYPSMMRAPTVRWCIEPDPILPRTMPQRTRSTPLQKTSLGPAWQGVRPLRVPTTAPRGALCSSTMRAARQAVYCTLMGCMHRRLRGLGVPSSPRVLKYRAFVSNIFYFLPHFRLYKVVSLHTCVLPYKYPYPQGCDLS